MVKTKVRTTVYIDKDMAELARELDLGLSKIMNDGLAGVLADGNTIELAKARERLKEFRAKGAAIEGVIAKLEKQKAGIDVDRLKDIKHRADTMRVNGHNDSRIRAELEAAGHSKEDIGKVLGGG